MTRSRAVTVVLAGAILGGAVADAASASLVGRHGDDPMLFSGDGHEDNDVTARLVASA